MRKFAIAGSLSAALAIVAFAAVATAATLAPTAPLRVQASVSPPHILKAPYAFRVTGTIVPPKILCPAGVTNPEYCSVAPANICSGQVSVNVALGDDPYLKDSNGTTNTLKATVSGSCKYSAKYTIPAKDLTAKRHIKNGAVPGAFVGVYTTVKYLGNTYMTAKSANAQITIAKLTNTSK